MRAALGMLVLSGCFAPPLEVDTPSTSPDASKVAAPQPSQPVDPQVVCDMSKFSFTQQSGCVNDGWVEFCAVKAGAPVTTALRSIAPDVSIEEGVIGHAGCDEQNDYYVREPLHPGDCTAEHGALTDDKWNTLCALSQVPQTKHFVPGWAQ